MTAAHAKAFDDIRAIAKAAGLLSRFDAEGVLVLTCPEDATEAHPSPAPPSNEPARGEGRPGGDGQG